MIKLIKGLFQKYRNFILYCCIGVVNTGVDFGVFALLDWAGLYYLTSNLVSYHCGIICSFLLNSNINFKVTDKPIKRFFSFYGISVVAIFISEALLYLFVSILSWHSLIAKLISMVLIAVGQFVFVKRFTFK